MSDAKRDRTPMGLADAVLDVIDILRGRPGSGGDLPDNWERIVGVIAENDSLSDAEVKLIEKAIAEACRGWSDVQRRSIWHETDSGMADDDSCCDLSLNDTGSALEVEMLDEVTLAAWQDARDQAAAKRPRRRNKATR